MTTHTMPMLGLLALTIGGTASAADAPRAGANCAVHFTTEGSFFAGKKLSTWAEFTAVSKADLYNRVYTNIAKDGWNITSSDKKAGIPLVRHSRRPSTVVAHLCPCLPILSRDRFAPALTASEV